MDWVFLDANVLFSAAWAPVTVMRRLWALDPAAVSLMTSDRAIAEVRRNLPRARHAALKGLLRRVQRVRTPPKRKWRALASVRLPDKDMAILQAAISGGATHLLTGDRRILVPTTGGPSREC